jgi:quercetin dioxygenase-like cupin family protein
MLRCIRLWTGDDGQSHFQSGAIELEAGVRGDFLSQKTDAVSIAFQETDSGGSFDWHTAPARQFVITLSGTLDFVTREDKHFSLDPSTLLLAEDTAGGGHSWRLLDAEPWRRIYVVLAPGADVRFKAEVQS